MLDESQKVRDKGRKKSEGNIYEVKSECDVVGSVQLLYCLIKVMWVRVSMKTENEKEGIHFFFI